jgi:tRNA pseudouridine38-40 synthase
MSRVVIGLEYDGSSFCGWQRQREPRTVQACVEEAISAVAAHAVEVVCAGRTDTGVHATGQVIHFDSDAERDVRSWVLGTNANLPRDIRVQWACPANQDFHARYSARARHYRYVILNSAAGSALERQRACRVHRHLNERLIEAASAHLVGEHDFSSFRSRACQATHPRRNIHRIAVERRGEHVILDVVANAFLHHMVRTIAGVLIAVGCGERSADWVREVLEARDRTAGGVTAPAAGLYLVGVRYPEQYGLPSTGRIPCSL